MKFESPKMTDFRLGECNINPKELVNALEHVKSVLIKNTTRLALHNAIIQCSSSGKVHVLASRGHFIKYYSFSNKHDVKENFYFFIPIGKINTVIKLAKNSTGDIRIQLIATKPKLIFKIFPEITYEIPHNEYPSIEDKLIDYDEDIKTEFRIRKKVFSRLVDRYPNANMLQVEKFNDSVLLRIFNSKYGGKVISKIYDSQVFDSELYWQDDDRGVLFNLHFLKRIIATYPDKDFENILFRFDLLKKCYCEIKEIGGWIGIKRISYILTSETFTPLKKH